MALGAEQALTSSYLSLRECPVSLKRWVARCRGQGHDSGAILDQAVSRISVLRINPPGPWEKVGPLFWAWQEAIAHPGR